jgi:hypothetical protein
MSKEIYNHEVQFKRMFQQVVVENAIISAKNKEIITDFLRLLEAQGLTFARRKKILMHLMQIVNWIKKDLDKLSKDDLIDSIAIVKNQKTAHQKWKKIKFRERKRKRKKVMQMQQNNAVLV